jgi:predicted nicotinamide N-methyase
VDGTRPREERDLERFVRERTTVAPVPLAPELVLHQATELTPLWHATSRELDGWDPSPYWAFPWAGGQALARFLLDRPELVRGRAVFDFASGSGLAAIAAARAGAASAVAADLDPFCAAAIRLNAALNRVRVEFRRGDAIGVPLDGFDVVLAGDVYYERALAERAHAWLRAAAARGALVLAGDPGRIYSPREGVRERAAYDVPTTPEIEASDRLRTRVLEVLPDVRARSVDEEEEPAGAGRRTAPAR